MSRNINRPLQAIFAQSRKRPHPRPPEHTLPPSPSEGMLQLFPLPTAGKNQPLQPKIKGSNNPVLAPHQNQSAFPGIPSPHSHSRQSPQFSQNQPPKAPAENLSPEKAAEFFRRRNQTLPDGVRYEPLDDETMRLLMDNGHITQPSSPQIQLQFSQNQQSQSSHLNPAQPQIPPSNQFNPSSSLTQPQSPQQTPSQQASSQQISPQSAAHITPPVAKIPLQATQKPPMIPIDSTTLATPYIQSQPPQQILPSQSTAPLQQIQPPQQIPSPQQFQSHPSHEIHINKSISNDLIPMIKSLAQDERNAQIFYSNLSQSAPSESTKNALTSLSQDCESRLTQYKTILSTHLSENFNPKETEINTALPYAQAISLAVKEESASLATINNLAAKLADTPAEKQIQRMINKKITAQQLLQSLQSQ